MVSGLKRGHQGGCWTGVDMAVWVLLIVALGEANCAVQMQGHQLCMMQMLRLGLGAELRRRKLAGVEGGGALELEAEKVLPYSNQWWPWLWSCVPTRAAMPEPEGQAEVAGEHDGRR